jgi:hypothetical protein
MSTPSPSEDYELRAEYDLSKLPVLPKGRYDQKRRLGSNVVLLDPDIARAFPTDEAVNEALRLVMQAAAIPSLVKRPAPRRGKAV